MNSLLTDLTMIVHCFLALIFSCVLLVHGKEGDIDTSRIVGGDPVTIEQFPYQISLQREGFHVCGGAIISNYWILTAGHCIGRYSHSVYTIRSGSPYHDFGGRLSTISRIIVHENFNEFTFDKDIAVIQLSSPLVFNSHTAPIPLTTRSEIFFSGTYATVTGWGLLNANGSPSKQLRKVDVPLVPFTECAKAYKDHPITEGMICAGVLNVGGKDACQGDSGGPMALNGKLIGIVSWGFGCAHPSYPGVYTRLTAVRDWIELTTGI